MVEITGSVATFAESVIFSRHLRRANLDSTKHGSKFDHSYQNHPSLFFYKISRLYYPSQVRAVYPMRQYIQYGTDGGMVWKDAPGVIQAHGTC